MAHFEDLRQAAFDSQKDLNSYQAKQGIGKKSDSTLESGVDEMVEKKFSEPTYGVKYGPLSEPTTGVKYGAGATASGSDHRKVPEDEGGTRDDRGRLPEAKDFQGPGGPEDKIKIEAERRPGDDDVPNLQDLKRRGLAG